MATSRLLLLILLLTAAPASGVTPYLVRDINPNPEPASSDPHELVSLGNLALFETGLVKETLWRSDGTAGGTYKLLENAGYFHILAVAGERCFFVVNSSRLWVTDGSLPGTLDLGMSGSFVLPPEPGEVLWVPGQRVLYFAAGQQVSDVELWRSDGTPGGTYRVADIWPGSTGSSPMELTSFRGKVYFTADDPVWGQTLWRTDGTASGTAPVRDVEPVPKAWFLRATGSRLIFLGTEPLHGTELWTSDGTSEGTRLVVDLMAGPESARIGILAVHRDRLYFTASLDESQPPQLWVTNGTARGTRALTRLETQSIQPLLHSAALDRFVFVARDSAHGSELWSTDGTVQGTRLVRDICPGECSGLSEPGSSFTLHEGRLFFVASRRARGAELWVTDGTATGTHLVRDICPGPCGSDPAGMLSFGTRLLFRADDGPHPAQIWSTDGTAAGTRVVSDFELPVSSFQAAAAGNMLLFAADDLLHGRELWCTDGTPEDTFLLADLLDEDLGGSRPSGLMTLGDSVLFFADDGEHGDALWKSDGTAGGTTLLRELSRPPLTSESWTSFGNRVFFYLKGPWLPSGLHRPPTQYYSLWTSDGTAAGTYWLPTFTSRALPPMGLPQTSRVFFEGYDPDHGMEPWITDGTPAGTRRLRDLSPGPASSFIQSFVVFQGKIWFISESGGTASLWQSDGTRAGTVRVGLEPRSPRSLTAFRRQLWFLQGGEDDAELWSTDGTPNGAGLRARLPFYSYSMFSDARRLYFETPSGIWVSDGTETGTVKISDLSMRWPWLLSGVRLYFATDAGLGATDGTEAGTRLLDPAGDEQPLDVVNLESLRYRVFAITSKGDLWVTDGTDAGTTLVRRLSSPSSSYAGELDLREAGSRVFFPAWDEKTGWELWAIAADSFQP